MIFEGENIDKEKLPIPSGWRLLVGMLKIEEKTAGGILLTDEHVRGKSYLRNIAKVLAVGKDCYLEPKFQGGISLTERTPSQWVKVGDVVMIGQYSGQEVKCIENGAIHTLKILNDDEILAIIPDMALLLN